MHDSQSHVMAAILARRSVRWYTDDPIPRPIIETLLNAAAYAPSAHNRQPWRFVVIETQRVKAQLATAMGTRLRHDLENDGVPEVVIAQDVNRSYQKISSAPVVILLCLNKADAVVYPDAKRTHNEYIMTVQSVAMAGQNLLLAAHDAGLGACWMCAPLFCSEIVWEVLGLSEGWQPQGLITLGIPVQQPEVKPRMPLETITQWR